MPNWVRNRLTIYGDNADKILQSLLVKSDIDGEYDFDFNKIIPMPQELNIEAGSQTYDAINLYLTYINPLIDYYGKEKLPVAEYINLCRNIQHSKVAKEPHYAMSKEAVAERLAQIQRCDKNEESVLALGKQAVENYRKYGATDWYEWCCKNWGTKWNAHNTEVPDIDKAEVYFDTAWSRPMPVLQKLSEMYPDNSFKYEYAEEQAGYFAGECVFENGELTSVDEYDTGSKESYEKFFELWGGEDEFKFNEKTGTYECIDEEEMD